MGPSLAFPRFLFMKSFFSSAAPAWCRFGAAAFVLVSLTNVASAVSVATNTFENPTLPLKVSVAHSGSGSFAQTTVVTHAQPFYLSPFGSGGDLVRGVEAYTRGLQMDPQHLRIGIYANMVDFQQLQPPAIGTIAVDVPDISTQLIDFGAPTVTTFSDVSGAYWTARFTPRLLSNHFLPSSSSPYWIVYSLVADQILELDGVASDLRFPESTRSDYFFNGSDPVTPSWLTQNRSVAVSIEYLAVPEIDPSSFGSALSLAIGAIALCERRRLRGCASAS